MASKTVQLARHLYPLSRFVGRDALYLPCVGLEVHVQVKSNTKLFSGAPASAATSLPNRAVSLIDVAHPGTLPRPNSACIAAAVRAGLAMQGNISPAIVFDRKHYFYADLPAGYQITQLETPIVTNGRLNYQVPLRDVYLKALQSKPKKPSQKHYLDIVTSVSNSKGKRLRDTVDCTAIIKQIQLEQDSGKSIHTFTRDTTSIDFNRAGVALMEIVTTPCFHTADEASSFLRTLQSLVRHIDVSDANIEDGQFRCDVNVSMYRVPTKDVRGDPLATLSSLIDAEMDATVDFAAVTAGWSRGNRVEMKNVASIKAVEKAIEYETNRQVELLQAGKSISPETRMFDVSEGVSHLLREKENAVDYRFMREPDITPIFISGAFIQQQREALPALLPEIREKLTRQHGMTEYDASVLLSSLDMPAYYDAVVAELAIKCATPLPKHFACLDKGSAEPSSDEGDASSAAASPAVLQVCKLAMQWITTELGGHCNARAISLSECGVRPEHLSRLLFMIQEGTISARVGKNVLEIMLDTQEMDPEGIVARNNWTQINDTVELTALCQQILRDPSVASMVSKYQSGSTRVFDGIVGRVMDASSGRANPVVTADIMKELLATK